MRFSSHSIRVILTETFMCLQFPLKEECNARLKFGRTNCPPSQELTDARSSRTSSLINYANFAEETEVTPHEDNNGYRWQLSARVKTGRASRIEASWLAEAARRGSEASTCEGQFRWTFFPKRNCPTTIVRQMTSSLLHYLKRPALRPL